MNDADALNFVALASVLYGLVKAAPMIAAVAARYEEEWKHTVETLRTDPKGGE